MASAFSTALSREPGHSAGLTPRVSVIAAVHPLAVGAAPFNTAMVTALRRRAEVDVISWNRYYPPLLYRGAARDDVSLPPRVEEAAMLLDWADPRTWRAALRRVAEGEPRAVVFPWLHPVNAPPYRWLLRHTPSGCMRVVICHNVETHERVRLGGAITRSVLRHADLLVTHAAQQRDELARLGLAATPLLESFHPPFVASDLAAQPTQLEIDAERQRLGNPDVLLLAYGAVRPYKGVDLAVRALALLDRELDVRLVVAGRFWQTRKELEALIRELGLEARVDLRDRYVSNEETALLFGCCDAAILPYRSASQSGVAALAFAHGRPVIATRVGGLPEAVRDGVDGLLCPPGDTVALAQAIGRLAAEREWLTHGVRRGREERSFDRYAATLLEALP